MSWEKRLELLKEQRGDQDAQMKEVNDLLSGLEPDVVIPIPQAMLDEFEEACTPRMAPLFVKPNY